MRIIKICFSALAISLFWLISFSPISGCTKTTVEHDTTVVRDTTIVVDTLYDIQSGLVAYYNFNGGSLQDGSPLHNNITFSNATKTADRFGNANNAYLFDGSTNFMQVPNSSSLNPNSVTLMAIVKVNGFYSGACSDNQIISKGEPFNIDGIYQLGFYDFAPSCGPPNVNTQHFWGQFGDNVPQGSAPTAGTDSINIQVGQWYNVIFTYDGIDAKLYINGELKSSQTNQGEFTKNNQDLLIGKHGNPLYPYWFNGVIDEVRIYNRALPKEAVQQLNLLKN